MEMAQEEYLGKRDKWFWIFYISRLTAWGIVTALFYPALGYWAILVGFGVMVIVSVSTYFFISPH